MRSFVHVVAFALVVPACGDNLAPPGPPEPCDVPAAALPCECAATLTSAPDLRVEDISGDGSWIAYSTPDATGRAVAVVPRCGGAPITVGHGAHARFDHDVLLVFGPEDSDLFASSLVVWASGDASGRAVATNVDPGATRVSRDGRWLAVEANEAPGRNQPPTLLLVDVATGAGTPVAAVHQTRARFSADSTRLIVGGLFVEAPCYPARTAKELDLATGAQRTVTCYLDRFELSRDDHELVSIDPGGRIMRTRLVDGESAVLFGGPVPLTGQRPFDVSDDGERVAFVWIREGIAIVDAAGGPPTRLVDDLSDELVDFHDDVLIYERAVEGPDERVALPPAGGPPIPLGLVDIVDHGDHLLLAAGDDGLQALRLPPRDPPARIDRAIEHAAVAGADRFVFAAGGSLQLFSLDARNVIVGREVRETALVGGFAVHDGWYAAGIRDVGGAVALRRAPL